MVASRGRREQYAHHREQHPALRGPAGHAPERVGERGGQDDDGQQLEQIREGRRIFEGVRRVEARLSRLSRV